jgi:thiol:disulfide interchange protein DsbA
MNTLFSVAKRSLMVMFLLSAFSCNAEDAAPATSPVAAPANYVEGQHFQVLDKPVKTVNAEKIEVAEVFWYGCPHCFHFEPELIPWIKSLPDDVVFVHVPAIWREPMDLHAKMYYTALQLNLAGQIHPAIFKAMNIDKKLFSSEEEIARFFGGFGIDREKFRSVFNSFTTDSLIRQAGQKVRDYQIEGTPEIIVNGKYRISVRFDGVANQKHMLRIASYLIDKERASMAAGKQAP